MLQMQPEANCSGDRLPTTGQSELTHDSHHMDQWLCEAQVAQGVTAG